MRTAPFSILTLLLIACGTSDVAEDPVTEVDPSPEAGSMDIGAKVQGLLGEWVDGPAANGTIFHEQWQHAGEGALQGLGFVMSGNDTVFIEELAIRWDDDGAYYAARIPTRNEGRFVHFELVPGTGDSLVFDNAAHDFPQRIVYRADADGTWHVRVSGLHGDTPREERFHFKPRGTPRNEAS
jgi:hypothetical protein